MLKKMGMILLALTITPLLSSCLVEEKDVETIARTTPNLRLYQAGDFIEYNVNIIIGSGAINQGTLHVKWEQTPDLIDPIDNNITHPELAETTLLKETTTLYESDGIEIVAAVIRYISQDSDGNITLYAIDDGTGLYWLYEPANTGDLSSDVFLPVIFNSPVVITTVDNSTLNSPLKFAVMEGCGETAGLCGIDIYEFSDGFHVVGDTTSVTTNMGIFSNPFEITFTGGTIPSNSPAIAILGDIRDVCGTSSDQVSHSGNMFVVPEIGMVQMTNLCQNFSTGGGIGQIEEVRYIINLSDTNIPLPPSSS